MTIEDYNLAEKCSGCFACYNICPVNAIELPLNKEGFYFPVINTEKCINCGKCVKVCSASDDLKRNSDTKSNVQCYSYQASDDIREKSSSGGVFYKIATVIMNQGGVVFGARYNPESKEVEHCSTDEVVLEELLRSKYVQSKIGSSYLLAKKYLQNERTVLFVGTPCQIYGLKQYLGKEYKNLYTMDFVCHGVPSTGYFRDWLCHLEHDYGHKILDVTFREKDDGWRSQIIKIYYDNLTQKIMKSNYYYYYYRYFLTNLILRKSCYHCNFPENRYSDFTVKDYWEEIGDDNKGVSAIVVNSDKGETLLSQILGNDLKLIPFDKIKGGFVIHEKVKNYSRYEKLREFYLGKYSSIGFEKTILKYNRIMDLILECMGRVSVLGGHFKNKIKKVVRRK